MEGFLNKIRLTRLTILDAKGNIIHLMTGPEETVHFVSRGSQCFPEAQPRETLGFEGNKMNCFPREQSLSDLLYSKRATATATAVVGQHSLGAHLRCVFMVREVT